MATARKGKALGWGIIAILLLAGAGVAFTRPAATPIPVAQLQATSATDAGTLALVIPGKYADRHLSLEKVGSVPATVSEIATEDGVSAVRLWSPSGVLLASSDPADVSVAGAAEKQLITAAHGAGADPGSLADQAGVVRIFEPVLPDKSNAVVAEFVRSTSEQGLPFKAIAAGLAALGVLALILALVSLRGTSASKLPAPAAEPRPVSPGGAAAPVPPTGEPREAGMPAVSPGVERDSERLVQKLKNSEASRAAMENQLEQLRAQLRMGTQGSDQIVAEMDRSLASSQQRAHEAGEQLALAEAARKEAEQRAIVAEEALSRATPSDATDRLTAMEAEFATARGRIAELEGIVAEHQARTRDAEARSGEAEKRSTAVTDQVAEHAARASEVEGRQAELEDRAGSAEARATQAERALAEAVQHAADLEIRVTNAEAAAASVVVASPTPGLGEAPGSHDLGTHDNTSRGSDAQLQLELARAQDLAEQALAKLETSEVRAAKAEAAAAAVRGKLADAESRMRDAEARAAVAGAPTRRRGLKTSPTPRRTPDSPPADLSLADSSTPIAAPMAKPAATPPTPSAAEPAPAADPEPVEAEPTGDSPASIEEARPSATDPGAWKALAKSLRRDALGDQAPEEIEDEEPEVPAAPVTPDDRSELRARLAKASAKKRRKIE